MSTTLLKMPDWSAFDWSMFDWSALHFLRPDGLWLLVALPLIVAVMRLERSSTTTNGALA